MGAGILQTLFDGGRKRAAVRAASAECTAVQAAYEQAVLNAFREIRDALVERRKSAEAYEASRDEVTCLRRSWDIASKQYEAGADGRPGHAPEPAERGAGHGGRRADAFECHCQILQGSGRRMAKGAGFRMRENCGKARYRTICLHYP